MLRPDFDLQSWLSGAATVLLALIVFTGWLIAKGNNQR